MAQLFWTVSRKTFQNQLRLDKSHFKKIIKGELGVYRQSLFQYYHIFAVKSKCTYQIYLKLL